MVKTKGPDLSSLHIHVSSFLSFKSNILVFPPTLFKCLIYVIHPSAHFLCNQQLPNTNGFETRGARIRQVPVLGKSLLQYILDLSLWLFTILIHIFRNRRFDQCRSVGTDLFLMQVLFICFDERNH